MAVVYEPGRIKLARESRGLSQAKLAKSVDVSSQQISEWERGVVIPGADKMAKLMTALGSPATFFFVETVADVPQQEQRTKERRVE